MCHDALYQTSSGTQNQLTNSYPAVAEFSHSLWCFCESLLGANAVADIEHYRPKAFSQQGSRTPKIYPGYYWLAYDWDNLFYCCQVCNRSHKKNYFPLRDQNLRARNHLSNLDAEEPLILSPGGQKDPRDHIQFRREVAISETDTGNTTIEIVGLNRSLLSEERLKRFQELKLLCDLIQLWSNHEDESKRNLAKDAQTELNRASRPEAEFSAMASDFLDEASIP